MGKGFAVVLLLWYIIFVSPPVCLPEKCKTNELGQMTLARAVASALAGTGMDVELLEIKTGKTIGIITGSGPEAGLDLWAKLLDANKRRLGPLFRGDLDAPCVKIISQPRLGLSMEMDKNHEAVWETLHKTAVELSNLVDGYAIACNTLNCFQDQLDQLNLPARLISFPDVVEAHVRENRLKRICLLGAKPVMELGKWSAYRRLPEIVSVEPFEQTDQLHKLIYDIKTFGASRPDIRERFEHMLQTVQSDVVFLACTELPLIRHITGPKTILDVTALVAEKLVDFAVTT